MAQRAFMPRLSTMHATLLVVTWLIFGGLGVVSAQSQPEEGPRMLFLTDPAAQLVAMLDDGAALLRGLRASVPPHQEQVQRAIRLDLRNFAFGVVKVVERDLVLLSSIPAAVELPALSRAVRRAIRATLLRSATTFRADKRHALVALQELRTALQPAG